MNYTFLDYNDFLSARTHRHDMIMRHVSVNVPNTWTDRESYKYFEDHNIETCTFSYIRDNVSGQMVLKAFWYEKRVADGQDSEYPTFYNTNPYTIGKVP